jgi:acetyl-CoA acetyltransferase
MGQTSENVAGEFNISREAIDAYAFKSHHYAKRAWIEGWTKDETVPILLTVNDPKTGKLEQRILKKDDGMRSGTAPEALARIRSSFPQWESSPTTGGSASQITDDATAVFLPTL